MNKVQDFCRLLIFCLLILITSSIKDSCQSRESTSMIDISNSKIMKTTVYEYKIENFNTNAHSLQNQLGQIIFQGNFSHLTLLNKALQKQYSYLGTQMILRVPSTHFYAKNKSAEAEIQIIYHLQGNHPQNRHKVVTMTQLYVLTRYLSGVSVNLCSEFNNKENNETKIRTSKLLKIVQKMPVLMYQGSKHVYPCRNDVLCMVRKQFAQISEEDLSCLKSKLNIKSSAQVKKQRHSQKSLFEVAEVSINDNEL